MQDPEQWQYQQFQKFMEFQQQKGQQTYPNNRMSEFSNGNSSSNRQSIDLTFEEERKAQQQGMRKECRCAEYDKLKEDRDSLSKQLEESKKLNSRYDTYCRELRDEVKEYKLKERKYFRRDENNGKIRSSHRSLVTTNAAKRQKPEARPKKEGGERETRKLKELEKPENLTTVDRLMIILFFCEEAKERDFEGMKICGGNVENSKGFSMTTQDGEGEQVTFQKWIEGDAWIWKGEKKELKESICKGLKSCRKEGEFSRFIKGEVEKYQKYIRFFSKPNMTSFNTGKLAETYPLERDLKVIKVSEFMWKIVLQGGAPTKKSQRGEFRTPHAVCMVQFNNIPELVHNLEFQDGAEKARKQPHISMAEYPFHLDVILNQMGTCAFWRDNIECNNAKVNNGCCSCFFRAERFRGMEQMNHQHEGCTTGPRKKLRFEPKSENSSTFQAKGNGLNMEETLQIASVPVLNGGGSSPEPEVH